MRRRCHTFHLITNEAIQTGQPRSLLNVIDYASGAIASDGQTPAQVPQSIHLLGSIT